MGSEELLRQNVFSSIHMSTAVKSNQVSVSYPFCSLCSGALSGTTSKKAVRKVGVFQITLYTNSSESFVVWCKKSEEPKGILWLRSCCVRRGSDTEGNMPIELLSKGCRGKCSYTLRFSNRLVAEEWYRSLKQESRKRTPMETDDPFSSDSGGEEDFASPLDRILSDTRLDSCSKMDGEYSFYPPQSSPNRRTSSAGIARKYNDSETILSSSLPSNRKPSIKAGGFRIPFGPLSDRKISLPGQSYHRGPSNTVNLLETPTAADLERWSWPVEVSH